LGHERVGTLPKTQKWRSLVGQIAGLGGSGVGGSGGATPAVEVADVAEQTVRNVSQQFRRAHLDTGVGAAFEYLVVLAAAGRSDDPRSVLSEYGIELPDKPTALSFAKAASPWLARSQESLEYGQMARGAVSDTIGAWYRENRPQQDRLFEPPEYPFDVWRKAGDGAGFCELARLFFASFTERHLNYYLEREASAVLPGFGERDRFGAQLNGHVEDISQHAFETARIAQSFAAGWFNRNVREGVPDREAIARFLSIAFGKIRGELLREDHEA
jgi:hypothetical protein